MRIDIGPLTQEETAELLKECIAALPMDTAIEALCQIFKGDERDELIASLEAQSSSDSGAKR